MRWGRYGGGLILLGVVCMVGCMRHNLRVYEPIDPKHKTVTVPPGSGGLKGDLKKALAEAGWKMAVMQGPRVIEGRLGEVTRLGDSQTFRTRYTLRVGSSQYDFCLNMTPAVNYEISFIDNETGGEVFTLEGRGCTSGVLEEFSRALGATQP